jgi:membrane-bound lytic murein transglycosylase F
MQLLPRTARELGFVDLHDPETAIHAGVKYMNWLRDRFEPELPVRDRLLFTLAAYNAGAGHVRDARRLAARLGKNPDRWFDNVEEAMLLLSRRQFFSNATHGYCRCREPVNYVREVWMRYNAYVGALRAAS